MFYDRAFREVLIEGFIEKAEYCTKRMSLFVMSFEKQFGENIVVYLRSQAGNFNNFIDP